jgi:hypothetical protein
MIDDDDDECGAVCGLRIGKGNLSTRRKPAPVPFCPPQIPHDMTWAQTWAAAVMPEKTSLHLFATKVSNLTLTLTLNKD